MRRALLAATTMMIALTGCATLRDALGPAPVGKPSGREGWLVYTLRDLRFEGRATWKASGGERRVALEQPEGKARLEVTHRASEFADEKACLADADERLRQQATSFERSRKHPTRFAGRAAQALEGDQGGWHVWAVAGCDGGGA
jgi:hypothetical protein